MHRRQIGAFENLEILKQSRYCLATLWLTAKFGKQLFCANGIYFSSQRRKDYCVSFMTELFCISDQRATSFQLTHDQQFSCKNHFLSFLRRIFAGKNCTKIQGFKNIIHRIFNTVIEVRVVSLCCRLCSCHMMFF